MSPPTVVVRGTGSIGMRHLAVLRELGVPALAWPLRRERDAELTALGYPVVATASDVAAAGASGMIVATDTGRHVEDATVGLELGCHVLVEKPLAPTASDARQLTRVAARAARSVHVACCMRFEAGLRVFRALLPRVGDVFAVRIECQSHLPSWRPGTDYRRAYSARADEGGVLRDLIHEIDYAMALFGMPAEVTATLQPGRLLGIASDEAGDLLWTAPGGAAVSLRLDYLTRKTRRRMTAFGTEGELSWDAIEKHVRLEPSSGAIEVIPTAEDRNEMMKRQALAFLDAIAGGEATDLATLADGIAALRICDAARASSAAGRRTTTEAG